MGLCFANWPGGSDRKKEEGIADLHFGAQPLGTEYNILVPLVAESPLVVANRRKEHDTDGIPDPQFANQTLRGQFLTTSEP